MKSWKSCKSKSRRRLRKRGGKSVKRFERLKCGPVQQNYFTCYDNNTLHKLRDAWNLRYTDDRIETNDSKEIWGALKQRFAEKCPNEACWMNKLVGNQLAGTDTIFAPESPKSWIRDPDEWLSSEEIEDVMKQYEEKFPKF